MSNSSVFVRREYRPPPQNGVRQKRQRPDLCIDGSVLADVVVSTPTCKSYVDRKINSVEVAANLKIKKYEALTAATNSVFYALAFSAYGGWSKAALESMSAIADLVVERCYTGEISRSAFLSRARRAMAVALTKGNANLVRTALRMSQRRVSGGISFGGAMASSAAAAAAGMVVGRGGVRGGGPFTV